MNITQNEGLDRIIDERDVAVQGDWSGAWEIITGTVDTVSENIEGFIAQVALLREACIEARHWILHNEDLENDSADWPLRLIKKALAASEGGLTDGNY